MSFEAAEEVARAVLLEGYALYPYRRSSLKNSRRFAFGTLYPAAVCEARAAGDASRMRTECVVIGESPRVRVVVKFLELVAGDASLEDDRRFSSDAVERSLTADEVALPVLSARPYRIESVFARVSNCRAGDASRDAVRARLELSAVLLAPSIWKLTATIHNAGGLESGDLARTAETRAMLSVHTVLCCRAGRFVSPADPAAHLRAHAEACRNEGTWPVLVGDPALADTMLSSPVILPDYPRVSEKSPGDLFDATEIDEILSLRIRTLTEAERTEARGTDARVRALIDRTEALGEDALWSLHGVCAVGSGGLHAGAASGDRVRSRAFAPGDHVVLRPSRGGDVFDLALCGEAATVLGIEEDVDGRIYYTVTVDADPGRDLGALGEPGHRFFFTAEELEPAP